MDLIELAIVDLKTNTGLYNQSYVLVLAEVDGKRRIPIIIGATEAGAIDSWRQSIKSKRPMTHDLFKSVADAFDFTLDSVYINDLKEGVYYAQLVCSNAFKSDVAIDSRPSDAIALAVRFGVPIFTNKKVLNEAGITFNDEDEFEASSATTPSASPASVPAKSSTKEPKKSRSFIEELKEMPSESLETMLSEALDREDYEKAAQIRDEMTRRGMQ